MYLPNPLQVDPAGGVHGYLAFLVPNNVVIPDQQLSEFVLRVRNVHSDRRYEITDLKEHRFGGSGAGS